MSPATAVVFLCSLNLDDFFFVQDGVVVLRPEHPDTADRRDSRLSDHGEVTIVKASRCNKANARKVPCNTAEEARDARLVEGECPKSNPQGEEDFWGSSSTAIAPPSSAEKTVLLSLILSLRFSFCQHKNRRF